MTALPVALGPALAAAAAGLAFGIPYFAALQRSVARYVEGGGRFRVAALTAARLAAAIGFFALAAHFGTMVLIAGFIGFLLARTFALRRARGIG